MLAANPDYSFKGKPDRATFLLSLPAGLPSTQAIGVNTDRITLRQTVFYRTTTQES